MGFLNRTAPIVDADNCENCKHFREDEKHYWCEHSIGCHGKISRMYWEESEEVEEKRLSQRSW